MARNRASLSEVLGDEDTLIPDPAQPTEEATPQTSKKAAKSPRKKTTGKKTAKKATKQPQKRTQAPQTANASADGTSQRPAAPQVRAVDTTEAKRVSLYLHPDDYRALQLRKLDDGADLNSRIRAMVTLWQQNSRFAAQVDRLAKSAPRGGQR